MIALCYLYARSHSAKAMSVCFMELLLHPGLESRHFYFYAFTVGCAVTHIIAGKDTAKITASLNWKFENIARRYVEGAKITHDPTAKHLAPRRPIT